MLQTFAHTHTHTSLITALQRLLTGEILEGTDHSQRVRQLPALENKVLHLSVVNGPFVDRKADGGGGGYLQDGHLATKYSTRFSGNVSQ